MADPIRQRVTRELMKRARATIKTYNSRSEVLFEIAEWLVQDAEEQLPIPEFDADAHQRALDKHAIASLHSQNVKLRAQVEELKLSAQAKIVLTQALKEARADRDRALEEANQYRNDAQNERAARVRAEGKLERLRLEMAKG